MTDQGAQRFHDFEAAGWNDGRAGPYHRALGPITARVIDPLLDAAGVGAGTRTLDVASGPGYAAARAAARGARVLGVDIAEEMVALAAQLHPGVAFARADAEELELADGSFAAVVANFLLPHLARVPVAVAEFARVLEPGGRLALSTWHSAGRARFLGAVNEAVAAAGARAPATLPPGPAFFQYADPDALARLLAGAGLVDVSVITVEFTHRVASLEAFWADLVAGTVRTRGLVEGQPPDLQRAIGDAYCRRLAIHAVDGGFEIPCAAVIGAASRGPGGGSRGRAPRATRARAMS